MNDVTLGIRIRVNNDGTVQVLNQTEGGINRISNASDNASRGLRTMESAAASLKSTLAPLIGIYELIHLGDKIIKDTATVQDLDTRLHSLTQTAGDYAQTVGYINTVADVQHKKINDLSDSYAKLRNLQNSGLITSQRTKEFFEGINNAASALGVSNDQLKQTFFGLSQTLGMLNAENFNQVMEPIPGLLQEMDKAAKLPAGGFRQLVVDGKATAAFFSDTLAKALHTFDGAAAATAQNINAKSTDISNSWTRLITSFEPATKAIFNPILDGVKNVLDATTQFNTAAITVGETNVSASSLAQGAWAVTTNAIGAGFDVLKTAGLGAAADTVSGWLASGDQMKNNVKFVVNDMIGLFVFLGHSIGIIIAAIANNFSNMIDNAIAKTSAAAGDVARMATGDFSFSALNAVVEKPMINALPDLAQQFKTDLSSDYLGTFTEAVKGASVAYQGLANEQKKAAEDAEQAKAKMLQLAASHNAVGNATGQSAEATKKAAAEAKKHADAIASEIAALTDHNNKMTLSERAYQALKLSALGMKGAVLESALALWDTGKALDAQKAGSDKMKATLAELDDKYRQLTLSAREYFVEKLKIDNPGITPEQVGDATVKFDRGASAELHKKSIDDARASLESYNKEINTTKDSMSDLSSVSSAVFDGALGGINTLAGAFSNMVDSIGKNTEALKQNHLEQIKINSFQPNKDGDKGQYLMDLKIKSDALKKNAAEEKMLSRQQMEIGIDSARQLSGAAAKMFGEKTAAAKAFHAIEVTLAVASMALKIQDMATTLATIPAKVAAGAASMFGQSGWGGFAGVAAMGAVMAGLGFAMSGGGASGMPTATSPDSGSVLGDSGAKSDSINKTYQLLKDMHAEEYAELRGINKGVSSLSTSITASLKALFQGGSLATPDVSYLNRSAGFLSSLFGFGGDTTASVTGNGIQTNATSLANVRNGISISGNQYTDTSVTKKAGWLSSLFGGGDHTEILHSASALPADIQATISTVFSSVADTMDALSNSLDATNKTATQSRINNYQIPALSIDLNGLNAEQASTKLNNVVSTMLDNMVNSVFGSITKKYQHVGEGMLETTTRVIAEVAVVKDSFATMGSSLSGNSAIAMDTADNLIALAGGIDTFKKQFDSFYSKFYTAAEQQTRLKSQLVSDLGGINQILPATRQGFRGLVEHLTASVTATHANTAAGRALLLTEQNALNTLLALSGQADTYYAGVEANAANDAATAKTQRGLDITLMDAQGKSADALTAKRHDEIAAMTQSTDGMTAAAIAAQNLAIATQNAIYAQEDYNTALSGFFTAADNALSGLSKAISKQKEADAAAFAAQKTAATDRLNSLKTQRNLDIQLMQAQGNAAGALTAQRAGELAAMTAATPAMLAAARATQTLIWHITDLFSNADNAMARLSTAVEKQKTITTDLLNSLNTVAGNIKTALQSTVVASDSLTRQQRLHAQSVLQSALITAQHGGSIANFAGLDQALADIAKPSEQLFSTALDYARDQARTAATLNSLSDYVDSQISDAERTLTTLDNILTNAQSQLDTLRGIDNSVLTVTDAVRAVNTAIHAISAARSNIATPTVTTAQISAAEDAITAIDTAAAANNTRLDNILTSAQSQVDALRGINTSVLSVTAAVTAVTTAVQAISNAQLHPPSTTALSTQGGSVSALNSTQQAYNTAINTENGLISGRNTHVGLYNTTQADINRINGALPGARSEVTRLNGIENSARNAFDYVYGQHMINEYTGDSDYTNLRNEWVSRFTTAENNVNTAHASTVAAQGALNTLTTSLTTDNNTIRTLTTALATATSNINAAHGVTVAALSAYTAAATSAHTTPTIIQTVTAQSINGSHANGLTYVPFDGYRAELHRGERVLTAEENMSFNRSLFANTIIGGGRESNDNAGNTDALAAEIRELRRQVERLLEAAKDTASNTQKTTRILQNVTQNRTSVTTTGA